MDNQPSHPNRTGFYGVKRHSRSQNYSATARVFGTRIELGSYSNPMIAACVFDLFKLLRGFYLDPFINRGGHNFPEASYAAKIDELIQRGLLNCPPIYANSLPGCRALFDYYYQARARISGPQGRLYNPSRRTAEGVHPVDKYLQLLAAYNATQVSSDVPQMLPDNIQQQEQQQVEEQVQEQVQEQAGEQEEEQQLLAPPLDANIELGLPALREPDLGWLNDLLQEDIVPVDQLPGFRLGF